MPAYFKEFTWIKGVPRGRGPVEADCIEQEAELFKIVDDPYHKRYSVERYEKGRFHEVVYDSILLDFRHLKPAEQQGWTQETTVVDEDTVTLLIRNQDDRVIYLETHQFESSVCRECAIFSPHGILLATNRMFYKAEGDATDGVVLLDRREQPVMYKLYETGEDGQFTELIEEHWDMADLTAFRRQFPVLKRTQRQAQ
jgi:hypothetical protein